MKIKYILLRCQVFLFLHVSVKYEMKHKYKFYFYCVFFWNICTIVYICFTATLAHTQTCQFNYNLKPIKNGRLLTSDCDFFCPNDTSVHTDN